MDEYTKMWFFYSWIEDREEKSKLMKDFGCFVGSFYNPEMARKIKDMENKVVDSDEEGFEAATKMVKESMEERGKKKINSKHRRVSLRK